MFCVLSNVTASTTIYTYLHTLSLHDALPISVSSGNPASAENLKPVGNLFRGITGTFRQEWKRFAMGGTIGTVIGTLPGAGSTRSEENTSELQSLMRISYAALCLKKTRRHRHHIAQTKNTKRKQRQKH